MPLAASIFAKRTNGLTSTSIGRLGVRERSVSSDIGTRYTTALLRTTVASCKLAAANRARRRLPGPERAIAPLGAKYLSPGRSPGYEGPNPAFRHPSPAGPPPGGRLRSEASATERSGPQGGRERGRGRGRVPRNPRLGRCEKIAGCRILRLRRLLSRKFTQVVDSS